MGSGKIGQTLTNSFAPNGQFQPWALVLPPLQQRFKETRDLMIQEQQREATKAKLDTYAELRGFGKEAAATGDVAQMEGGRRQLRSVAKEAGLDEYNTRAIIKGAGLRKDQIRKFGENRAAAEEGIVQAGGNPNLIRTLDQDTFNRVAAAAQGEEMQRQSTREQQAGQLGVQKQYADYAAGIEDRQAGEADARERSLAEFKGGLERDLDVEKAKVDNFYKRQQAQWELEHPAPTEGERAFGAYQRALLDGDEAKIEVTRNEILRRRPSGAMTIVGPDGSMMTGDGSQVLEAVTQTTRNQVQQKIIAQQAFLRTLDEFKAVLGPDTVGLRGKIKGSLQDMSATFNPELTSWIMAKRDQAKQAADPVKGAKMIEMLDKLYDPKIPAAQALTISMAAAIAIAQNPGGRPSDFDMQRGMETLQASGLFANPLGIGAALETQERLSKKDIQEGFKMLESSKPKEDPLAQALRAYQGRILGNQRPQSQAGATSLLKMNRAEVDALEPQARLQMFNALPPKQQERFLKRMRGKK